MEESEELRRTTGALGRARNALELSRETIGRLPQEGLERDSVASPSTSSPPRKKQRGGAGPLGV